MCGISGFYSSSPDRLNSKHFEIFNSSLSHRGPDFSGILRTKYSWIGHNRLAIIDLTTHANQPLHATHQNIDYSIVFNGEIYNYIEIREQLKSLGHSFKTQSDTEVVLKSYIEWGAKCYSKFNGMWALAIYNHKNDSLHLSRDRFGVKPLYLYFHKEDLFFASEVKAFAKLPQPFTLICNTLLLKFLVKRPDNQSILKKPICCLPAGNYLTISNNKELILKKWWDLEQHIPSLENLNSTEVIEKFKNIFISALELRTRSDAKLCSSLSGGLDSSTIVSVQAENLKHKQNSEYKAFIFEYKTKEQSELQYALNVCEQKKVPYTLYSLDATSKELNPQTLTDCIYTSEQLGNLQIGPYLLYESMQKEGYKVSIDGHGADEILGGYIQFAIPSLADALVTGGKESFQKTLQSWKNDDGTYLVDPNHCLNGIYKLIKSKDPKCDGNWMTRERKYEFQSKTLPWLLNTYDKMPMRHGIEVRSPFLDYRLVTFAFALSNNYLVGNNYTKNIIREAFKHYLPSSILTRKNKKGFLPSKFFFLNSQAIREMIADISGSEDFKSSKWFDGINSSKSIHKAIESKDINSLHKNWPLIQTTLFVREWQKNST